MTGMDNLRRYIEAATSLSEITRSKAESLVRELASAGEIERSRRKEWVDTLVKDSRQRSERLMAEIREEVHRQVSEIKLENIEETVTRTIKMLMRDGTLETLRDAGVRALGGAIGGALGGTMGTARRAPATDVGGEAPRGSTLSGDVPVPPVAAENPTAKSAAKKVPAKTAAPAKKVPARKAIAKNAPAKTAASPVSPSKNAPVRKSTASRVPSSGTTKSTGKAGE